MGAVVDHECHRLAGDSPAAWRDGGELLGWLQLV
jgi:hypothetical protein